ncbi:hypothetical protein ACN42_g6343 [Penicillium freii]|uniref:Uncharacterized protein n=1 Tax=Penicillium freii TaxID=48697 RepID=A0A101MI02_PENFR|nr:hypothetical protein ACN42_g6343 [Penicillium freii]
MQFPRSGTLAGSNIEWRYRPRDVLFPSRLRGFKKLTFLALLGVSSRLSASSRTGTCPEEIIAPYPHFILQI